MNIHRRCERLRTLALGAAALAAATCGLPGPAGANDFYTGKQIIFLIGGDAGGGYDLYARALSRHMGRFIPGAPIFVARNQPGAGSGTEVQIWLRHAPCGAVSGPDPGPDPTHCHTQSINQQRARPLL